MHPGGVRPARAACSYSEARTVATIGFLFTEGYRPISAVEARLLAGYRARTAGPGSGTRSTVTDRTADVVIRRSPVESSILKPTPIHPSLNTLPPVVAPSSRPWAPWGNLGPPLTVTCRMTGSRTMI